MADKVITYSTERGVGQIVIDRPPANSYDLATMQALDGAISEAANDDKTRAVLLRSASEKFFCAGADITALRANTTANNVAMITFAHEVLARIASVPKIFIAVINGHALGGGLEVALACDLRFAGDGRYRLGLPEVSLGMLPGNGGTQRLPRLIGKARALSMMIAAETIGPQEALELGIIDRLFPPESLWDESLAYAQKIASGATLAIGNVKRAVHGGLNMPLADGLRLECDLAAELFDTEDAAEGIAAFVEKREAVFKGR